MAKISPISIKYMIYASFRAEGALEKPDVIGAIFGQTEGLLGDEMEMRDLQKEGKIGRIEVEIEVIDGKSIGTIKVPSALDKSETTILAALLETIDKVGPTEAQIKVTKIEDVRGNKREYIINRAKELLNSIEEGQGLEEINKTLKEEARVAKIQEYGEEKLPVGDISGKEIIIVEGRADVINLLKNRINNVIGMNGTKLPAEIIKLCEEKEVTLFIDGDRGGKLIAKNLINSAKISYVAVAPDGKEVEELTGKEILMALRKKIPVEEYLRKEGGDITEENEREIKNNLKKIYEELKGTKNAILLDNNLEIIKKVSVKDLLFAIKNNKEKIFAVIMDGLASASIINGCEEASVDYLAASNFSKADSEKVKLISL